MTIRPRASQVVSKYTQTPPGFQGVANVFMAIEPSVAMFGWGYSPTVLEYGVGKTDRGLTFSWNANILNVRSSSVSARLRDSVITANVYVDPNSKACFSVGLDQNQPANNFEANYRISVITGGNFTDITFITFGYLELVDPNGSGGRDDRFRGPIRYAQFDYNYDVVGVTNGLGMRNYNVLGTSLANIVATRSLPTGASDDFIINGDLGGNNTGLIFPSKYEFTGEIDFNDGKTQILMAHKNFIGVRTLYNIYNAPINGGADWTSMACFGNINPAPYTASRDYACFPNTNQLYTSTLLGDARHNGGNIKADTMGSPEVQMLFSQWRTSGRSDVPVYAFNCYRFLSVGGQGIGYSQTEADLITGGNYCGLGGELDIKGSITGPGYNGGNNTHLFIWLDWSECLVKYRFNTFSEGITLDSYIQNPPQFDDGIGQFTINPALIPDVTKIVITSLYLGSGSNANDSGGIQSQWSDVPSQLGFVFASRFPRINSSGNLQQTNKALLFQTIDDDGKPLPY